MTGHPWARHPALLAAAHHGIRTRLGISPNHPSFRVGVLRTHLLTALLTHAASRHYDTTAHIVVRCDDTNSRTARPENLPLLLREIHDVAGIPTTGPVRFQTQRLRRHLATVDTLDRLGVTTRRDGAVLLDLHRVHTLIRARGDDPDQVVRRSALDPARRPPQHPTRYVPLVRADGTVLWHLASVVDDIDLNVNLVVRGTDKCDALAVQAPLRHLLTDGAANLVHVHLPRLLEPTGPVRVGDLTNAGIRPSALRWYLAEPFLHAEARPQTFTDLVDAVRPTLPAPRDSRLDQQRLAALDRKLSAALHPEVAAAELAAAVGHRHPDLVDHVAQTCRRPLPAQIRRYAQLTQPAEPRPPPAG